MFEKLYESYIVRSPCKNRHRQLAAHPCAPGSMHRPAAYTLYTYCTRCADALFISTPSKHKRKNKEGNSMMQLQLEMQESDRHTESDRRGSCPTKPNLTTPEIVDQFPCRTLFVSNTSLRPFNNFIRHNTVFAHCIQCMCNLPLGKSNKKKLDFMVEHLKLIKNL